MSPSSSVPLRRVATIERTGVPPGELRSGDFLVGLEHFGEDGSLAPQPIQSGSDIASTKFRFDASHILYGKLRPNLRKVARPAFAGVCSTDILPIRPHPDIDRDYLFHFLRTDSVTGWATSRAAGANLPRLSPSVLLELQVPLRPLAEQRRIAAILDRTAAIRLKRQDVMHLTNGLLRSAFRDRFGDIAARRSPYAFEPIRSWVTASSGKSSQPVLSVVATRIPIYGGNGVNGWATRALYDEPVIVVGRVGQQCGITHLTNGPAWVTDNAIVVRVSDKRRLDPVYLAAALQHSPLRARVQHLDLPFVNQDIVLDSPIPLPPIEHQQRYAAIRHRVLRLSQRLQEWLDGANGLFKALVDRAFQDGLGS